MVNGLAFAGVTGSGKSTLLKLLSSRLTGRDCLSLLLLRNNVVQNRIYDRFRADRSLDELSQFLARPLDLAGRFQSLAREPLGDERGAELIVLLESWLLNLCAELEVEFEGDLLELDRRRAELGIAIVHLHFPPEMILERSVVSTRRHRGRGWGLYLDGLGTDAGAQARHFIARRGRIAEMFEKCRTPKLSIDTRDMAWEDHARGLMSLLGVGGPG